MAIIYEVNVALEPSIKTAYLKWLIPHVEEILAMPGFQAGHVHEQTDATDDKVHLSVHYVVDAMPNLKRYLAEDAPRLRADADKHFGGKFTAWRRVLTRIESVNRG